MISRLRLVKLPGWDPVSPLPIVHGGSASRFWVGSSRQVSLFPSNRMGWGVATKITREVLEAYLNCKTKAYLKLGGQQGIVSDYEALLAAKRQAVRQQAIGKILARNPEGEVARDIIPDRRCPGGRGMLCIKRHPRRRPSVTLL